MSRVVLKRPEARLDLVELYAYIGHDSSRAVDRFLDAADKTFAKLAQSPRIGRPWLSSCVYLGDVRVWRIAGFRRYLVFYRPISNGIEVLHVLHGARDIEQSLADEDTYGGAE
jgi:toxin ParE1/3/4